MKRICMVHISLLLMVVCLPIQGEGVLTFAEEGSAFESTERNAHASAPLGEDMPGTSSLCRSEDIQSNIFGSEGGSIEANCGVEADKWCNLSITTNSIADCSVTQESTVACCEIAETICDLVCQCGIEAFICIHSTCSHFCTCTRCPV